MGRKKSIKSETAVGNPKLIKKNEPFVSKPAPSAPTAESEDARVNRLRKEWLADRDTKQAATALLRTQLFS